MKRDVDEQFSDAAATADPALGVHLDDGTAARGKEAGATVMQRDSSQGYGAALRTAFEIADRCLADHLVILDGDDQHDPSDIPRLVDAQTESGAEIVVDNRFGADAEMDILLYRRFCLGVINLLTNLSMGPVRPSSRGQDTQCGFRAYVDVQLNRWPRTIRLSYGWAPAAIFSSMPASTTTKSQRYRPLLITISTMRAPTTRSSTV